MRADEIEAAVRAATGPMADTIEVMQRGLQPLSEAVATARAQVEKFSAQQQAIVAGARHFVSTLLPPSGAVHLPVLPASLEI